MAALAMSTARLAAALPDFGEARRPGPAPVLVAQTSVIDLRPVGPTEGEIAERIAAAVAQAETALADRLSGENSAAIEALAADHAAALAEAETEIGARLGEALAQKFSALEVLVADLATTTSARILANLLSDEIARRSVEALAIAIRDAIADSDAIKVKVRGPQSMFEQLEAKLGARAPQLVFTESATADLTVAIDETQFETRLAEWQRTVAGIVAGDTQ